jgi:hypothetical protein
MCYTAFGLFDGQAGTEFEDFDVLAFDHRLESLPIDHAGSWSAMVPPRELHIMDVESSEAISHGSQVKSMIKESDVFFDLGVPGIVPVGHGRRAEFF